MKEIIAQLENASLSKAQLLGLCALICIAQREETTISYQQDEWGFVDVPADIISQCDAVTEDEQLAVVVDVIFACQGVKA